MKKLLFIGSVGCGKTTLLQRLHGEDLTYSKTETIYTEGQVVDTPGEYLEMPWFKHALRLASFEVELVVLLASATVAEAKFPPGFTTFFAPPSIGVVTKTDLADERQVAQAGEYLKLAGVTEVLGVSALTGAGLDALVARVA